MMRIQLVILAIAVSERWSVAFPNLGTHRSIILPRHLEGHAQTVETLGLFDEDIDRKFKEYLESREEFLRYQDKQKFRAALAKSAVFAQEDAAKLEQVVFQCVSCIKEYSEGELVYKNGEHPLALFFVRSGEFQCDLPSEMGGPQVFAEGEYFGGLGILKNQAPFGAKAIGKENSVWRVDQSIYEKVFPLLSSKKQLEGRILSGTGNTAQYIEKALELIDIKNYLNQSYVFKGNLTESAANTAVASTTSKTYRLGEVVYEQGDLGESLYVIQRGEFDVYEGNRRRMTLGTGRLFGEFGAFIDQSRAFTVKAGSDDCAVWEIPGVVVQELRDDLATGTYLAMVKDKYADESTMNAVKRLLVEEPGLLISLARSASTPKKRKVSSHSTLSSITFGASLLAIAPHVQPKFANGSFQLAKLNIDAPFHLLQLNTANILLTIVMLMGQFRFPYKTLRSRKVLFNTLSIGIVINALMGLSNLMGYGIPYIIDAWSWQGRLLIGAASVLSVASITTLFYDIMTGPKAGRDANPFFETRWKGLAANALYSVSKYAEVTHMLPMFDDRSVFKTTAEMMVKCGATCGTLTYSKFMSNFHLSMGALYATFQYEKRFGKESVKIGNRLLAATAILCLTDLYKFVIVFLRKASSGVQPFNVLKAYMTELQMKCYLPLLWFVPNLLAIIVGGIQAYRTKTYQAAR